MNPAHAVLCNDELLKLVCENMAPNGRRDLIAFALVCPTISEVALDFAWENIEMQNLYPIFPQLLISTNSQGHKSLKLPFVTPEQWSRIDLYVRRIRSLRVEFFKEDTILCSVLERCPHRRFPFENLRRLVWSSDASQSHILGMILSPHLTNVAIKITPGTDDHTIDSILVTLKKACPELQEYHYFHPDFWERRQSIKLQSVSSAIIHCSRNLRVVSVPANRLVLHALASLPSLSTLSLHPCHWPEPAESQLDYETTIWESRDLEGFAVLDRLTIRGLLSLDAFTEIFHVLGCFPKKTLELEISKAFRPTDIFEVLDMVLQMRRVAGIQTLSIKGYLPLGIARRSIPWQQFRPILSLSHLRNLHIHGLLLSVEDSDLEEISQCLRELRTLEVLYRPEVEHQSPITFSGLAHLAFLPNLLHAKLTLSPTSSIVPSWIPEETYSNSPMTELNLNVKEAFSLFTISEATLFLGKFFPKLEKVTECHGVSEVQWGKVEAGLLLARRDHQAGLSSVH